MTTISAAGRAWPMYRAMVGVGLVCGVAIVAVFQWTLPVIRRNRAEALERAIFHVLPQARSSTSYRLGDDGRFETIDAQASQDGDLMVHAGYDDARRLVGLAVEAQGMGYQDVIRLLYGYAVDEQAIVGIRVLESKETPGLGDRIEKDETFLENFRRLDAALNDEGTSVLHPIVAVKRGKKEHPWQVDGITGATISSVAVADILRQSTAYWIPLIQRNLDAFVQE